MSTSAEIQFKDTNETFALFQQYDAYPESPHGVFDAVKKSLSFAWRDGRFEASEFACAYIRANKVRHGGLYLLSAPTDISNEESEKYVYVITSDGMTLTVECFQRNFNTDLYEQFEVQTLQLVEEQPSPA